MCKKVNFETLMAANTRIAEIDKADPILITKPIRAYYCTECNAFVLTKYSHDERNNKITKHREKIKKKEQKFIDIESAHWEKKFEIKK